MVNQMRFKIPAIVLIIIAFSYPAFAQPGGVSVSAGLSTTKIIGSSPNINSFLLYPTGGYFSGFQPGIKALINFNLDQEGRFVLPIGIDYVMYETGQRFPFKADTTFIFKHSINIPTFVLGLNYHFIKMPVANTRLYVGAELRGSFVESGTFSATETNYAGKTIVDSTWNTKPGTFRLGGNLMFGFTGEISAPLYISSNLGVGILNLVGRNNSRGELLTPSKDAETKESLIYNLNFSLMLQYRLR
jgi:hypothetical protein